MTVKGTYPGLATGVLKAAELKEMPAGLIFKAENLEIRESQLREKIAGADPKIREQQILGARFGTRSITVQVFFDESGQEVFRHEGFFAEGEVRKQLAEMGLK